MAHIVASSGPMYENIPTRNETPWLHGSLSRDDVTVLMQDNGMTEGLFLIRESQKRAGDYVLSVFNLNKIQHYIITNTNGVFSIDDGPKFTNLSKLVDYYTNTTDRLPTRLATPILATPAPAPVARVQESYEPVWEAGNSDQAQLASQTMTMGSSQMLSRQAGSMKGRAPMPAPGSSPTVMAVEPGDPYLVSSRAVASPPSNTGTMGGRNTGTMGGAGSTGTLNLANREKLAQVPRVKKWIDQGESINSVQMNVQEEKTRALPEGFSSDAAERAQMQQQKFSQAALAEEKMYLVWFNAKLKKVDKSADDIGPSLKNGCLVMEVLKMMTTLPAPNYAKRPTVVQQEVDNWHVVIKFMRKMGIVVDNVSSDVPEDESVGLDPVALHSLDRREILKLFSKLLLYESMH